MKLKMTQLVDGLCQEFQKSQCAMDKYTTRAYVRELIFFSRGQNLSSLSVKNMIPFHYYNISLKFSFQVYSLKQHPELMQLRKPCLIMRLFRAWEEKSVTIKISRNGSASGNECILFINENPLIKYCTNDNFR